MSSQVLFFDVLNTMVESNNCELCILIAILNFFISIIESIKKAVIHLFMFSVIRNHLLIPMGLSTSTTHACVTRHK